MSRTCARWTGWTTLALALASAFPAPARAQSAAEVVQVRCEPVRVAAGTSVPVPVVLEISPGWHVNANPPAPDYLIPTVVKLEGAAGLTTRGVSYPPARQVKLSFDEHPLSVYDGTVTATVTLDVARDAVNGRHALRGTVRYQCCNDEVCPGQCAIMFFD